MKDAVIIFNQGDELACDHSPVFCNENGECITYVRCEEPPFEVLASESYSGKGMHKEVFSKIFEDGGKLKRYREVYNPQPYETEDGEYTPPDIFGHLI